MPRIAKTLIKVVTFTPNASVSGFKLGAISMIAPTFKSRLAQPSRQRTMPGANSSPTPQWQNERVLPMDIKFFLLSKVPPTPATALSCRSMSVAAKSLKFTLPALITKAASARITSTSISILLPEEVLGIARHRRFHFFLRQ